jgi:ABC-type nitrate/sulfonate/bicarbonate transport system substrate-binding protein
VLRRVLRFYGLDPDNDVTILNSGDVPARWAALQSGNADAAMFSGGEWIQATELGMNIVANAVDVIDMPENGFAVSERKLAEQPELVKAVLNAMLDTVTFIYQDPVATARVLAEWTGLPEDVALQHIEGLQPSLARELLPTDKALYEVIRAEADGAGIAREVAPGEVTDFTLLHEVLGERGAAPAASR